MTYAEVIRENCETHSSISWWPRFAYHYTDVTNAVGILASGILYSRVRADAIGVMTNDNASRQIIDMTENQATSYARFYFRPLSPTQFHNEGYKHCAVRYCGDVNANVPVPIFLLFDLEKMLALENTCFSESTQAGHGAPIKKGMDDFSKLPFDKIYSYGPADNNTLQYRHAEILYPMQFPINGMIKYIFCRNECEKATLLNLLRMQHRISYDKYKDIVKVAKDYVFYRNGLFIDEVILHEDSLSFIFSDAPDKIEYVRWRARREGAQNLENIKCNFLFEWLGSKERLYPVIRETEISYLNAKSIVFNKLPSISKAKMLRVSVLIEGKPICVFEQALSPYELM